MYTTSWPSNHYDLLFDVWQEWTAAVDSNQSHWPMLDRWLKKYLRAALPSSSNPRSNSHYRSPVLDLSTQLAISSAMFAAMRFLQLAGALEQSYRDQRALDWQEWDKSWSPFSIQKIPPAAFWYWIALRSNLGSDLVNLAPKVLRDAADRKAWFVNMESQLSAPDSAEMNLLWQGLRPQWWPMLSERAQASGWSNDTLLKFIEMQNQPSPLWLRAQRRTKLADLQQALENEGVVIEVVNDQYLLARGGAGVNHTKTYAQGLCEIQDLASQQIAEAVAIKPGDKVWDACAGAGGKSLAIAARMANKGALVATDLHAYKLDELKRRAKRADIFNIRTFEWQGKEPLRLPKEIARQQGFDWVLIDAPCSSAGTWRRNPDARWRLDSADTAELIQLQKQIMHNASFSVRVSGHLVYATCSWQLSENEMQVANFLQEHPEFSLVSQGLLGAPAQDSDTMFVAVMKRDS